MDRKHNKMDVETATRTTTETTTKSTFKTIFSWALYDWGNSSYFAVVTTFIFAAYFTSQVAPDKITGTFWWGNTIGLAALVVAILSPICGSIADYGGHRKYWLFILTYVGIIATAFLWFAYPSPSYALLTLLFVMISTIAFEIGMAFYNSLLPSLAPKGYLGRISGWAWGLGYAGGLSCLTLTLIFFVKGDFSWLTGLSWFKGDTFANIRIAGPFVALWVLIFSLPLFLFVPDAKSKHYPIKKAIKYGLADLKKTLIYLPKERNLFLFFISRLFYIDGLNTLFAFGGIYAAGTFHMDMSEIILFGIVLNITAGIGAVLFAWVDDWIGSKKTIMISLCFLLFFGIFILFIHSRLYFWLVAPFVGIFVGPIQAASRSLMVRISPEEKITEMFGLFALSGKATAFIGPWLVGLTTEIFLSQRAGMAIINLFYVLGLILLFFVKERSAIQSD